MLKTFVFFVEIAGDFYCQSVYSKQNIVNHFFPFAKKHMVCYGNSLQILLELWEVFIVNQSVVKIMLFNPFL
jgi:hypothetical protein